MENIVVSVIVPIYKVPLDNLHKCIQSILGQTHKNIEILLVDDGSPDRCGEVCDYYASYDSRVTVIHKQNGGLSAARNTGFLAATGEYITFVDGDDWIEQSMIRDLLFWATESQVQLAMCAMYKDYGKELETYTYNVQPEKIYRGNECKWLQEQLLNFNGNISTAYCKLIKRDLLVNNRILHDAELRQGAEGIEFNLRLFEKLDSAIFINVPLYHYMYNSESISAKHDEKNHYYVLKCFAKILEQIKDSTNSKQLLEWFYNRILYVIITTAISGYFSPTNREAYSEKKKKFSQYMEQQIVRDALHRNNTRGLSTARRIVLVIIKLRCYMLLEILGKIRRWQKESK